MVLVIIETLEPISQVSDIWELLSCFLNGIVHEGFVMVPFVGLVGLHLIWVKAFMGEEVSS